MTGFCRPRLIHQEGGKPEGEFEVMDLNADVNHLHRVIINLPCSLPSIGVLFPTGMGYYMNVDVIMREVLYIYQSQAKKI
jgi:hypothetical protein